MAFGFRKTEIPDVVIITPKAFGDPRGFFMETYKRSEFRENGIDCDFVQFNHSKSNKNVLRGLHYQMYPYAQGKLVRALRGSFYAVAVDLRKGSPYYGRHVGAVLSEKNRDMIWVPKGFAFGNCALEDGTELYYCVTDEYGPESQRGVAWDDPNLGIEWPTNKPLLSEKDSKNPRLKDAEINFIYGQC